MGFAEDLEMILLSMLNEEPTSNPELETLIPHQLLDQEVDMLGVNLLSSHETIPHEDSCARVDHLLPGFRFLPTDQELIYYYLNKKINNEQIPYEFIPSINIYKHNPQELTGADPSLGKNEWYFFTTRDRKYLNGNRPNRAAAGYGYWKATGADKPIYDGNVRIGFKRSLVFYEGEPTNSNKTNWLMHEYMVDQPPQQKQNKGANDMLLDNCVLCRIYMNPHRSTKVENESEINQATTGNRIMRIEQEESYARVDHLPPGFRYVPTDQELINYYLNKKINNEKIPCEFIPSINIYMHNPQELTAAYPSLGNPNNEWYFFTPRDRKYPNGSRPNRAAGNGHWKATIADKPIYDDNVCIGFKKTLVFYEGKSTEGKKTNWIMHEYILGHPPSKQQKGTNDMLLDNCVLCRIYKRTHGAAKDEKQADQDH